MVRSKLLAVLGGLLVLSALVVLVPAVLAQGDPNATIRDSDDAEYSVFLSDKASIRIAHVSEPPADSVYEGWFVSDDGSRKESTGILVLTGDGTLIEQDFWLAADGQPTGENLFGAFDKFVVTVEPVDDPDPGPSDVVAYIHAIPAGGILHIRHLLYSWAPNPVYAEPNFHAGTPKGIAVGLREQMAAALTHAGLSASSDTLALVQLHACHVINIVEGTEGANFDLGCGNPGDDFGVLNYAADTIAHAQLTVTAAPGDAVIAANSASVVSAATAASSMATDARDSALDVVAAAGLSAARILIQNVEEPLTTGLEDSKAAYWGAQDMGTYTLAAPSAPPITGDINFTTIALAVLAAGAAFLFGGGYMLRRARRRA